MVKWIEVLVKAGSALVEQLSVGLRCEALVDKLLALEAGLSILGEVVTKTLQLLLLRSYVDDDGIGILLRGKVIYFIPSFGIDLHNSIINSQESFLDMINS